MILTKSDLFGRVEGKRFIVHKLPQHVLQLYQAFACNEARLTAMFSVGVEEALIFFHPNEQETIAYRASVSKWIKGTVWGCRKGGAKKGLGVERQRVIPIKDCEKL